MRNILGLPLEEALSSLPKGTGTPRLAETAAPRRDGSCRQEGTLRVVACRGDEWILARFLDREPRERKEEP